MMSVQIATRRQAALAAGGVALAVLLVAWFVWWSRPPRMGADKDALKTVDALFTAVTARDEKRLAECEQRLHAYRDNGKLPKAAADGVVGGR